MLEAAGVPDHLEYIEVICDQENNEPQDLDEMKINVEVHMKHATTKLMGWFAVTTNFRTTIGEGDVPA